MTLGGVNGPLLVLGEARGGVISGVTWELTGKARQLADEVNREVVLLLMSGGLDNDPASTGYRGADRVIDVRHPSLALFNQEIQARVLLEVLKRERPSMVLAPATSSGRTVMPIAAAGAKTGLTADCTGLEIEKE
ncbi:MAG: electron transfer flavoprotein subunit alpha, partial [Synergistota bacterium]|nr:electron transfer flavoprotein subunit alpha [Synergistota bacterium]